MKNLLSLLIASFLGNTLLAQQTFDLSNPISIAQYQQDQDMKKNHDEADYSRCIATLANAGLNAALGKTKISFYLNRLPNGDRNKSYSVAVSVCSADKKNCIDTDQNESKEFNLSKISQNVMTRELITWVGCAMAFASIYKNFTAENLQIKLYEKMPFYRRDILIGTNNIRISRDLYEKTVLVPLNESGDAAVELRVSENGEK